MSVNGCGPGYGLAPRGPSNRGLRLVVSAYCTNVKQTRPEIVRLLSSALSKTTDVCSVVVQYGRLADHIKGSQVECPATDEFQGSPGAQGSVFFPSEGEVEEPVVGAAWGRQSDMDRPYRFGRAPAPRTRHAGGG